MSQAQPGFITKNHNSEKHHKITVELGDTPMHFETGRIAKQAGGAIMCRWGDSVTLTTVCAASKPREGIDFFPLTCEYLEKAYAAGKIPGGFFKREARPRTHEILNARITDRSIRPLFPDGYRNEVQVITTVISHDGIHDTDAMALSAASMALHISEIPYAEETGPIGGVRVGRKDGKLIINPTLAERNEGELDLIVAMSKDAIVMVEGGAAELGEDVLNEALFFGHEQGQKIVAACQEMRKVMGKEKLSFTAPVIDDALKTQVRELAEKHGLRDAVQIKTKHDRYSKIDEAKAATMAEFKTLLGEDAFAEKKKELGGYFGDWKANFIRTRVVGDKIRIDGRGPADIRQLCCEINTLPCSHGSAIFTRGETQAIVTTTLGTSADEMKMDTLQGTTWDKFMLHYNFPPFSVGEARGLRGTSRRELGHGALAQRAVCDMLPDHDDFPYTVRVVSEITESNGSSSMASVCGASMSMMHAGVPLKAPIAGIAMGLIQEGKDIAVLSDILGDEDHIGDMDFKVCGTEKGVTAIQMDIKIDGLTREIMSTALKQARDGRLHILKAMNDAISAASDDVAENAPRFMALKVNPDKIRDIIGPGGKTIRDIVARTDAKIDVEDDGTVRIYAVGRESAAQAKSIIEDLTREAQVNRIYKGLVRKVLDFGAFVELFPGTDGLLHISELADKRVDRVTDIVDEGDEVVVKVLAIDRDGKIRLSRRQATGKEPGTLDAA